MSGLAPNDIELGGTVTGALATTSAAVAPGFGVPQHAHFKSSFLLGA